MPYDEPDRVTEFLAEHGHEPDVIHILGPTAVKLLEPLLALVDSLPNSGNLIMSNRKQCWPTTKTFGMELPIIADVGDGWFLVAHPNGAAIANERYLSVLWTESTEATIPLRGLGDPNETRSPIPETSRAKAVEEFAKFAWPLVREKFYTEGKGEPNDT